MPACKKAFREEANILRLSVNELAAKRAQLGIENGRLERQVKRMSVVEERFEQLVQREGKDIEAFRQLVREGAAIQQEMKVRKREREREREITFWYDRFIPYSHLMFR